MKKKFQSGFTLIELLVVIAIIGILASVVLASLNTARAKGADAAIKSQLANLRAEAEIFYDDTTKGNGTYGTALTSTVCSSATATNGSLFVNDNSFKSAITNLTTTAGTSPQCAVGAGGSSWAMAATLKVTSGTYYCVDSTGASKTYTGASQAAAITGSSCS